MSSAMVRFPVLTMMAAVTLGLSLSAQGQLDRITVAVAPEQVGLAGAVRPGTWAPMRVTLGNPGPEPREVAVQWAVSDSDDDVVLAQRVVTLTPQRDDQRVWLYACPPLGTASTSPVWQINVLEWIDGRLGRRLADTVQVSPARLLPTHKRAIGLTSSQYLGLDPFEEDITQHEPCEFLRGMLPTGGAVPDRWHGLSLIEAFIWTGDGGDPGDADVPTEAIRQWVQRGGHLVIVLSNSLGWDAWAKSPLAPMLPQLWAQRVEGATPPGWFGKLRPDKIDYFRLQPAGEGKTTVVLEDDQFRPVAVAAAYGFGRVTVLGLDLTDPKVSGMWLPYGQENLWNVIFRWRTRAESKTLVQSQVDAGRYLRPMFAQQDELGRFIPAQVSRSQTIAVALLLAIMVFTLYWLAAGPIGFAVLRGRGLVRHSWLVFIAVVAIFSVVTWGGAMLLRPTQASISHLTVLDIDGAKRTVHARSWMSLFMPEHGGVAVTLAPDMPDGGGHVWASSGLDPHRPEIGYVDRQTYVIDAASPSRQPRQGAADARGVLVPMRATTKSFNVDYLGPLQHDSPWLGVNWVMPVGDVTKPPSAGAFPTGTLRHGLPGDLRNVLVIYCPGGDEQPFVLDYGTWPADATLTLDFTTQRSRRLIVRPSSQKERWGGMLGELRAGGNPTPEGQTQKDAPKPLDANVLMNHLWMLSFFGTLPPPDYEDREDRPFSTLRGPNLARSVGREIDITALTGLRRLIVIGMIDRSPLPVPLSVDGRRIDADGWTLVRWHLDLE